MFLSPVDTAYNLVGPQAFESALEIYFVAGLERSRGLQLSLKSIDQAIKPADAMEQKDISFVPIENLVDLRIVGPDAHRLDRLKNLSACHDGLFTLSKSPNDVRE